MFVSWKVSKIYSRIVDHFCRSSPHARRGMAKCLTPSKTHFSLSCWMHSTTFSTSGRVSCRGFVTNTYVEYMTILVLERGYLINMFIHFLEFISALEFLCEFLRDTSAHCYFFIYTVSKEHMLLDSEPMSVLLEHWTDRVLVSFQQIWTAVPQQCYFVAH
jgi:hypothetical protein